MIQKRGYLLEWFGRFGFMILKLKFSIYLPSDPPTIAFIINLSKKESFGVTELDENHILINSSDPAILQKIQDRLDELLDENAFERYSEK